MGSQKDKIKVMHIILNLRRAGAQEVVRTLSEYLVTADDCVLLICTFVDGPLRYDLEKLGVKVELLGGHHSLLPMFEIRLILANPILCAIFRGMDK